MLSRVYNALFAITCHPLGQRLVKTTRIVPLGNLLLRWFPVHRSLPGSDLTYRLPFVDSFLLARGVFFGDEYRCPQLEDEARHIQRIVDLGCNVGYFLLYVEHLRRRLGCGDRALAGLAIDCNRAALDHARAHFTQNGLSGMECVHGVAGGRKRGTATVYIAVSSISSTAEEVRRPVSSIGVSIRDTPFVDVESLWAERFGGQRVDLCKIDIEGSEVGFLQVNQEFMARVDRAVIEWHKPQVTLASLVEALQSSGNWVTQTLHEDSRFGVLWAARPTS
jgi:FkbM family methyltransferase